MTNAPVLTERLIQAAVDYETGRCSQRELSEARAAVEAAIIPGVAQAAGNCGLTAKQQASKILFGDIHWMDREDMADLMDADFVQDDGTHQRNISPNALIAELEAARPSAAPVEPRIYANGGDGTFDENDEPAPQSSAETSRQEG